MRKRMPEIKPEDERTLRFSHFTVERAPDAVIWIDSEGCIYRANDAACQLLGFDKEELISKNVYDLSPEDNEEKLRERWKAEQFL